MLQLLCLILHFVITGLASGADSEFGPLSFCKFGPKLKVIQPVVSNDSCSGTTKIQALMWKCTRQELVEVDVSRFHRELNKLAAQECEKFCSKRGANCSGIFTQKGTCGLSTTTEESLIMGKREGCREDCSGRAFAFCSIYDASYRTDDPPRLDKVVPNCRCKLLKK